jgi:hypothetical protein
MHLWVDGVGDWLKNSFSGSILHRIKNGLILDVERESVFIINVGNLEA